MLLVEFDHVVYCGGWDTVHQIALLNINHISEAKDALLAGGFRDVENIKSLTFGKKGVITSGISNKTF